MADLEENAAASSPREEHHKRRRAAGKLDLDNLAEEDIDDQDISVSIGKDGRLIDDELLSFVNVYFSNEILSHDAYQTNHSTHPEVNRNGSRIVWVENSQTGELIPLARRTNTSASRRGRRSGSSLNQAGSTEVDVAGDGNDEDDALLDLEQGATGSADPYSNLQLTVPPLPPPLDESLDPRTGKVLGSSVLGASGAVAQALQKQEEEIAPIVRYHNLVMVQRATYLVFQGLLAGFSFTTLFTQQATAGSDSQLLVFYQPNAADYRRFFYILSSIALVGSLDLCVTVLGSRADSAAALQQHPQQGYSSTHFRAVHALRLSYDASAVLLSLLIALLYAVAFIVTLLMSTFDVLTMVRDGFPDTDQWPTLALHDSEYSWQLEQWKAYNSLRVICSVSGWIGSCLFVWKDLTQLNYKSADLFRLRETTVAWSGRVREMEGGPGLDSLRPTALKRLLAILKVGTDRARDALSFYEQEQRQQQAPASRPVDSIEEEEDSSSLLPKQQHVL